jgi:hypothetical protein
MIQDTIPNGVFLPDWFHKKSGHLLFPFPFLASNKSRPTTKGLLVKFVYTSLLSNLVGEGHMVYGRVL